MKKFVLYAITFLVLISGAGVIASDLTIDSKSQSYAEDEQKLKFDGDVKVTIDNIKVVSDRADVSINPKTNKLEVATFYDKPYAFEVKQSKKHEVKANILKLSLLTKVLTAEGDSQSIVTDGKKPVVIISADTQEYDTKTNIMTATGAVEIKYKDLSTFSNKAIIVTDKSGDLKKIDLYGNAKISQERNTIYADHFTYTSGNQNLIAIGNTHSIATMENGQKLVLKSNYQQYNQSTNIFVGSGKVRIWYQDYYAEGPKVTLYPDKQTQKPNEAYFTGRSSITQNEKTIYADKIKMTLNPKDFEATGNARTLIRNIGDGSNGGFEL